MSWNPGVEKVLISLLFWGTVTGHGVTENDQEEEQHAPCVRKDGTSKIRFPLAP